MIDLKKNTDWEEINELIQKKLGVEAKVKIFHSVSHALIELTAGFQLLYSHKKQYCCSLGLGTHALEMQTALAKQGVKAIECNGRDETPIDDKKTLFYVCDVDDAITGESIYNIQTSPVDPKLFRILVFHEGHRFHFPQLVISEMDICIFNYSPQMTVALLGKRLQNIQTAVAPTLRWGFTDLSYIQFADRLENQKWVNTVETEKWASGFPLEGINKERIYDRAILYWPDLDASCLRSILIKDYKIEETLLETVNLTRWNETKLITQYEKRGWSPEQFRGTLLMSAQLSKNLDFKQYLEIAVKKLKTLSGI